MKKAISTTLVFLCVLWSVPAVASVDTETLFEPWGELLERYLEEKDLDGGGLVTAFDYEVALGDPEAEALLEQQRRKLADVDPDRIDEKYEAIAFWLNAYNFFMVDYILENRVGGELIDSVWDYGGRYNPFRDSVFTRESFEIGGRKYSLDEMEKGILLGDEFRERGWKDARVHFAVNCASVGCPPLREEYYTGDNTEILLEENTRRAFLTDRHLTFDNDTLKLTSVIRWYREDYEEEAGTIRDWVMRYVDGELRDRVSAAGRIDYLYYDWSLNRPENFPEFGD